MKPFFQIMSELFRQPSGEETSIRTGIDQSIRITAFPCMRISNSDRDVWVRTITLRKRSKGVGYFFSDTSIHAYHFFGRDKHDHWTLNTLRLGQMYDPSSILARCHNRIVRK